MVHLKQVQTITDILYGTFEVEAVLGELLTCDALLRLKNIHQGGGAFLVIKIGARRGMSIVSASCF